MSHDNPADYLERAAELIALDNGAINRTTARDEVVEKMLDAVKAKFSVSIRADVEEYLSTLTADELDTLCCGEQGGIDVPHDVEAILNEMFDNM